MQSEIAAQLNFSVPTVKEHLSALESAGLVERFDEGRKWKYYALTKKGKGVLHPEDLKIFIVLSTFVVAAIGTIVSFFRKGVALGDIQTFGAEPMLMSEPLMAKSAVVSAPVPVAEPLADVVPLMAERSVESAQVMAESVPVLADSAVEEAQLLAQNSDVVVHSVNYSLYIFLTIAVISLIILAYLLYRRKNYKHMLGKSLSKK
jgi:DNA-binding Lrp family transcriptional regulator